MLPEKISFVDIETTGTSLRTDRIIDIGIIRVEHNQVVDTFTSLVNPGVTLHPFIAQMTGIGDADLESAPSFHTLKEHVFELLSDSVFVAHNVRFDYGFVKTEFERHLISFKSKHFCTVKLSRALFPQERKHNLDSVIERFHLHPATRHRALPDALVLWEFYQAILKLFPVETIAQHVSLGMRKPTIPLHIDEEKLESLPETAGVYIFYGENELPLYVGKSIHIKERVKSHFSQDHASGTEMKIAQQVRRIASIKTAGELGALLTESELVKSLQPLYNRKLRQREKLTLLVETENEQGFKTCRIEETADIDPTHLERIVGVFRSKKQATDFLLELAKKYQLCQRFLGLEKTKRGCFSYQLGICKGACVGQEKTAFYNARFVEAVCRFRLKRWPFDGKIVISEENLEGITEAFVVENWCLLGRLKVGDAFETVEKNAFDLDTYKILTRYILHNKNQTAITPLPKNKLHLSNVAYF